MNNFTKNPAGEVSAAQKTRDDYLQFRRALRLIIGPPTLHADNPLLPDTPDDSSNQLPRRFQGQEVKVEVPAFELDIEAGRAGLVYLEWDGVRQPPAQYSFTTPIAPGAFPIQLTLPPTATLAEGHHTLTFVVNVSGNITRSEPLAIYLDRTAPNFGQKGDEVTLPAEVDRDGITKEYLDANGGVTITLPEYSDRKIGDVIDVFYGKNPQSSVLVGTVVRQDTTTPVTVSLSTAQVGTEEGNKLIYYTLRDRVGNVGPDSNLKSVRVILSAAPTDLKPLTVPLADPGIDINDARVGVDVQIEQYTNFLKSDLIAVTWDGIQLARTLAVGAGPTFVRVPYAVLLNGNVNKKNVDVTYQIVRGDFNYPEPTTVTVPVDLRTPGPVNPDDPDPVNPNLDLVVVQGAVTTDPNKLTEADAGQPATAKVTIYEEFKAKDVVQLYWNGTAVPDSGDPAKPGGTYVVIGDEADDFEIDFAIPWAIIEAAGNAADLPVNYSIAQPDINEAVVYSGDQPVEVLIKAVTLPEVKFLNLDEDFGVLNCNSLRNVPPSGWVAQISVAGGEPALANQLLTFNYVGLKAAATPITHSFTFTPTVEQANNGFVVNLPYDPPLIRTRDGDGSIEYSAIINGFPATSAKHEVDVFMATAGPGSPTCNLNRAAAKA